MARNPMQFQNGIGLNEFLSLYGTEQQCFDALYQWRWPNVFVCPNCGHDRGCQLGVCTTELLPTRRQPAEEQRVDGGDPQRFRWSQVSPDNAARRPGERSSVSNGERSSVSNGMHQTHVVPGKQAVHSCKILVHLYRMA